MITDEIVEAIDALVELCGDEQQELGMKSVREMLCDFSETEWNSITKEERTAWLEGYLSCRPRKN